MKHLFLLLLLFASIRLAAQTANEVKSSQGKYYWGEGSGTTLEKADRMALRQLIEMISVQVESKFELRQEFGRGIESREKYRSVLRTYSSASLNNTERMILSEEPDARVFRYVTRENAAKIFEQRKNKILQLVRLAEKAEQELRIDDALRNYSWAMLLLISHPDANDIYISRQAQQQLLYTEIPARMRSLFAGISITIHSIEKHENISEVRLQVKYKNRMVQSFDYRPWDGNNYSNIHSIKNGNGMVEYHGAAAKDLRQVKLKAEYLFANEASVDKELEDVMEVIDLQVFRKSYYTIPLDAEVQQISNIPAEPSSSNNANSDKLKQVANPQKYQHLLERVVAAIRQKNYASVKQLFTTTGYSLFEKLIAYGNAKVLYKPNIQAYKFNDGVMARSVSMSFAFRQNRKKFVEEVVFQFDGNDKISSVAFALSKTASESIFRNTIWSEENRLLLVNFLEHYKTAYALKQLDFIESIFAEDALIITGSYRLVKTKIDDCYKHNRVLQFNRYSKNQYIKKLRYIFNSKEYINIKFEESDIRKSGTRGNVYGIQIKQNYYSSNYGDSGWLFLMVDLNDQNKPLIHIRTWQPKKDEQQTIYNMGDF